MMKTIKERHVINCLRAEQLYVIICCGYNLLEHIIIAFNNQVLLRHACKV